MPYQAYIPLSFSSLLLFLTIAGLAEAQPCEHERIETLVLQLDNVNLVSLEALAGDLDVQGSDRNDMEIRSRACSDSKRTLEDIRLFVERTSGKLVVNVIIPSDLGFFGHDYAFMDLEVSLPSNQKIEMSDSSGDITLQNVAVTRIEDSSGKIKGTQLNTDLHLQDTSGDVVIRTITGNATLKDSSGDLSVRNVSGNVHILVDSSGNIDISHTAGEVVIDRDSSGDIDIDTADGVIIDSDGSGNIEISHVTRSVHIGSDGSGTVRVRDVGGNLSIDAKGDGEIHTQGITGDIRVP